MNKRLVVKVAALLFLVPNLQLDEIPVVIGNFARASCVDLDTDAVEDDKSVDPNDCEEGVVKAEAALFRREAETVAVAASRNKDVIFTMIDQRYECVDSSSGEWLSFRRLAPSSSSSLLMSGRGRTTPHDLIHLTHSMVPITG